MQNKKAKSKTLKPKIKIQKAKNKTQFEIQTAQLDFFGEIMSPL